MSRGFKYLLILILSLLFLGVSYVWALPRMIAALPGQYRYRLPDKLIEMVTTPLPTALPAPAVSFVQPRITVPAINLPTATLEIPTLPATYTRVPVQTPVTIETAANPVLTPKATSLPSPTVKATVAPTLEPTAVLPPTSARLEGLEVIPQKFNNCGPTNLSITMSYFGHTIGQLEIAEMIKPDYDDRNVSPEELVWYVNEQTPLRASLYSGGDLLLLKQFIAAGFPVVIEKGLIPSQREGWMGHYLTLFGYDDAIGEFYGLDTFLGPWDSSGRPESYESISEHWKHFNYTFFVVYHPEQQTKVYDILGSVFQNTILMWQQAALKSQAEIGMESEDAFAWFNLGTNLTRLAQITDQRNLYEDAVAAFDQARSIGLPARMLWYQFDPYVAYLEAGRIDDVMILVNATLAYGGQYVEETYVYQSQALLALGDEPGATAAYNKALQLNPSRPLIWQVPDQIGD